MDKENQLTKCYQSTYPLQFYLYLCLDVNHRKFKTCKYKFEGTRIHACKQ